MDRFGDFFPSESETGRDPFEDDFGAYSDSDEGTDAEENFDSPPPSPVGQDERRMQVRAYNHWAGLLEDAPFPDIADLDPGALDDFGPYSVLLDFREGMEDPEVRFLGSELASECGAQVITRLSDVPSRSLLSRITDHYMQILANQAPIGFEAEFVNERGNTALYRGILLPFSSDHQTIDFIYGVINWKEMADRDTADALLLEIGQALGLDDTDVDEAVPPPPSLDALLDFNDVASEEMSDDVLESEADDILDLGVAGSAIADEDEDLPLPSFGDNFTTGLAEEDGAPRRPQVPASMAPGNVVHDDWADASDDDGFEDGPAIGESAQDYGLDDEWDEPDYDDVDDVVDPLADESVGAGLSALVSRGARLRPVIELPSALDPDAAAPVPEAYEAPGQDEVESFEASVDLAAEPEEDLETEGMFGAPFADDEDEEPVEFAAADETDTIDEETDAVDTVEEAEVAETEPFDLPVEAVIADSPDESEPRVDVFTAQEEELQDEEDDAFESSIEASSEPAGVAAFDLPVDGIVEETDPAPEADADAPDGAEASVGEDSLYDTLAEAREMAAEARNSEDRTRGALYAAVGRAYDFSLEAQANPEAFAELIQDAGMSVQERAPMTPIVKLVFGSAYDKTRLTEYAAVLSHAHRVGVERGALGGYLAQAEGGLKGIVQAERRARKEEAGQPVEDTDTIREALAQKLRDADAMAFADLPEHGAEFALLMVRRSADGGLEIVGEVPEDIALIERAARKLVG